jgi:hypothetical protein
MVAICGVGGRADERLRDGSKCPARAGDDGTAKDPTPIPLAEVVLKSSYVTLKRIYRPID